MLLRIISNVAQPEIAQPLDDIQKSVDIFQRVHTTAKLHGTLHPYMVGKLKCETIFGQRGICVTGNELPGRRTLLETQQLH